MSDPVEQFCAKGGLKPPVEGMKKIPMGMRYFGGADFLACALNVAGFHEACERFKKETGHDLNSLVKRTPLDRMIDSATGRDRAIFCAFLDWVVVNIWCEEGKGQ